ncbi:hypothetical protein GJAV_G00106590 [Gymnothorax javanicus]|nr:hypothetical protein GJAV_G00106590 [Gymnothorax javanicus]
MSRSSAHCSAINCRNRQSKRPDLSFFRFPKQKDRCRQWAQNAGRVDLINRTALYVHNNCRLCAEHFTDDQFSNRQAKTRLKWNAFPSLFQVRNPPKAHSTSRRPVKRMRSVRADDSSLHSATAKRREEVYSALSEHAYSIPPEDSPRSDSPGTRSLGTPPFQKEQSRTFSLKRPVESLKKSMEKAANEAKSIAELIKSAKTFLDKPALSFFALQLRNSAPRRHRAWGGRWSYDDEVTALSLYRQSPRAYMFCRRVFALPSVPSPRRWLRGTEMRPGFPQRVFDLLKKKVACMCKMGKLCVVAFGKMKLSASCCHLLPGPKRLQQLLPWQQGHLWDCKELLSLDPRLSPGRASGAVDRPEQGEQMLSTRCEEWESSWRPRPDPPLKPVCVLVKLETEKLESRERCATWCFGYQKLQAEGQQTKRLFGKPMSY